MPPLKFQLTDLTTRRVSFFNIAVALVRFSKFYRFQGRLDILNKTIIYAFENLYVDPVLMSHEFRLNLLFKIILVGCRYHYLAIFFVVFGGYAAMGHFLFGMHLVTFSTMGRRVYRSCAHNSGRFTLKTSSVC
jgi:hypothetical protein